MQQNIIDPRLLEILVCPQCRGEISLVEYKPAEHGLKCSVCKKIYPIRDGIPDMLIEEAISSESSV